MIRAIGLAALLLSAVAAVAGDSPTKPIATVALPCESMHQVVSPSGGQVAVDCRDRSVSLVNLPSGTVWHTFPPEPGIESHTYSADGRWFAIGRWDGAVEVVSTSGSHTVAKQFRTGPRVETLNFFPDDGGIIVGDIDGAGQVWDLRSEPKHIADLKEDFGGLIACEFSPDGKLLVAADGDTGIRFYDVATWRLVHEYRGLVLETFAVAFADDGNRVLIAGPDDHITELDRSGAVLRRLDKETDVVQQILTLDNGKAIVLYSDAEGRKPPHASLWDMETGKSSPLSAGPRPTGGGVVRKKSLSGGASGASLWVTRANGNSMQVLEYEMQNDESQLRQTSGQ